MLNEGAATWLGGGNKGSPEVYYQILREYLHAHPNASLTSLLDSFAFDAEPAFYATGALITAAVVRRGGPSALRRLLSAGPSKRDVLGTVPGLLGIQPAELDEWWRREARSMTTPGR